MTITESPQPAAYKEGRLIVERFDDSTLRLSPFDEDHERVIIQTNVQLRSDGIERGKFERTDPWIATTDAITGLAIEVRRAPCGSVCRCSAEVRVPS